MPKVGACKDSAKAADYVGIATLFFKRAGKTNMVRLWKLFFKLNKTRQICFTRLGRLGATVNGVHRKMGCHTAIATGAQRARPSEQTLTAHRNITDKAQLHHRKPNPGSTVKSAVAAL